MGESNIQNAFADSNVIIAELEEMKEQKESLESEVAELN